MENESTDVSIVLATQDANQIGSLNLQVAKLRVENNQLKQKVAELSTQNENLRKRKGDGAHEPVNNNPSHR